MLGIGSVVLRIDHDRLDHESPVASADRARRSEFSVCAPNTLHPVQGHCKPTFFFVLRLPREAESNLPLKCPQDIGKGFSFFVREPLAVAQRLVGRGNPNPKAGICKPRNVFKLSPVHCDLRVFRLRLPEMTLLGHTLIPSRKVQRVCNLPKGAVRKH